METMLSKCKPVQEGYFQVVVTEENFKKLGYKGEAMKGCLKEMTFVRQYTSKGSHGFYALIIKHPSLRVEVVSDDLGMYAKVMDPNTFVEGELFLGSSSEEIVATWKKYFVPSATFDTLPLKRKSKCNSTQLNLLSGLVSYLVQ